MDDVRFYVTCFHNLISIKRSEICVEIELIQNSCIFEKSSEDVQYFHFSQKILFWLRAWLLCADYGVRETSAFIALNVYMKK